MEFPVGKEIGVRTQTVLSTLYLLFNEGYYSKQDTPQLHKDFCLEALRLCLLLSDHKTPTTPQVYALIALMCFHASRFEARYKGGAIFFYKEQDRTLWNKELKEKGEHYLTLASQGEAVSKYHLEAAIAYWHTEEEGSEK